MGTLRDWGEVVEVLQKQQGTAKTRKDAVKTATTLLNNNQLKALDIVARTAAGGTDLSEGTTLCALTPSRLADDRRADARARHAHLGAAGGRGYMQRGLRASGGEGAQDRPRQNSAEAAAACRQKGGRRVSREECVAAFTASADLHLLLSLTRPRFSQRTGTCCSR